MLHYRLLRSFVNILSITVFLVACQTENPIKSTDYISSPTNKLKLLEQNEKLLMNLYEYIERLHEKIETLRKIGKHLHQPQVAAKGREEEFLSNPMNSLSLIRQTHADWTHVEILMEQPVGQKQMDYIRRMNERRPQLENVEEALVAMHRMKESYLLNVTDIAKGLLDGMQTDGKLSPLECYEMGLLYFNGSLYHKAVEWLEAAKKLMDKAPSDAYAFLGLRRSNISYLLAKSYTALGDLQLARIVLQIEPDLSSRAEQLLEYFQQNIPPVIKDEKLIEFNGEYAHLCSSSYKPKPTRLLCSYKTSPTPFLRLAPFQMEQISKDPDIFVFHNMISSSEIALLEGETEALMDRELVIAENDKLVHSNHRTLRHVWLPHPQISEEVQWLVSRIKQRMEDFSDLIVLELDPMEMLKYGFGGHFSIHSDFYNFTGAFMEDRIATIVVYLNDVPSGGGTMFPKLNMTVKAEAGKALLWYSIKPDTFDYETRTEHAGCPVKIGTKLVLAHWLYEHDHMFSLPCRQPPKTRIYIEP
ncbi:prolyl 4-hydroxylase subunit alpha-2-like [Drosophila sulfurigaster albostrigata]|uniref:prolyl 4-hydroxylase subunit alpha-2-like n=1 Tax=Drosophila sulfurigaster albostrigata TaxID=89887 RepID=UPI002D21BE0D|nr:prolyl 4-hydroxylase subunit alpha-2-like [Drosophila sulfurigaster albostrigata]